MKILFLVIVSTGLSWSSDTFSADTFLDEKTGLMWQDNSDA